jgi:hypothetical protein
MHVLSLYGVNGTNLPFLIPGIIFFSGTISTRMRSRFRFLVLDLRIFCFGICELYQDS